MRPHDSKIGARAFTLLEVLLAVGAAAVIAVGIAAVFAATGDVVTGGRRVSHFSRAAAQIEAQLREDVARMTREGPLIIRNEIANDANNVELFDGQLADRQRPRRVDELVFFARGEYTTAREAVVPGAVARADAARIYYGHGTQPAPPTIPGTPPSYAEPFVDDTWKNGSGTGAYSADSLLGASGPDQFASNWILLRHVTLLARQQYTEVDLPSNPPLDLNPGNFYDLDSQVALQPAAAHIFRKLNEIFPDYSQPPPPPALDPIRGKVYPTFASGLVDIATTDLTEIRSVVVGMQGAGATGKEVLPNQINNPADFESLVDRSIAPPPLDLSDPDDEKLLDGIQEWMKQIFPAESYDDAWDSRVRMRAEHTPPDYLGALQEPPANPLFVNVVREQDQMMLTASDFQPTCSEFIVEWSFGEIYPPTHARAGETIWHGLERFVDADGDGTDDPEERVAVPYDATDSDFQYFAHTTRYLFDVPMAANDKYGDYPVGGVIPGVGGGPGFGGSASVEQSWLIHGSGYKGDINDAQLFSFFGYHDPTFDPLDPNRDLDTADAAKLDSNPWPWPKMLRITMNLADPTDPSIEETFQFVIELPARTQ